MGYRKAIIERGITVWLMQMDQRGFKTKCYNLGYLDTLHSRTEVLLKESEIL